MGRILLLAAVAVVEALLLLLLWTLFCAWVGEFSFPSFGDARQLLSDHPEHATEWLFVYGVPVGVAAASIAFIAPFAPPIRLRSHGRSLRSSVIAASFIGGGLAFGAIVALVELALIWAGNKPIVNLFDDEFTFLASISFVIVVGWVIWTAALWKYGNRRDRAALGRLLSLIFRGTLIELAIAIPAYAYVRRKEDCYCSLGTFWALACGLGGLLFVCGPGALLLWQRRRGSWLPEPLADCSKCGYRRVAGVGERCPECGADWTLPR